MAAKPKSLSTFLAELKRRRVFRVTAVYAGVAFIVSEIVANTFGDFGIPEYFNRAVYILLILGFPVVIGLAWAFDLTEKGLVRTKSKEEAAEAEAPHPIFGNKTLAIIAVLAVIVAAWALLRGPLFFKGSSLVRIGVIPFRNLSADSTSNVYADGVTAEIISELASIKDLHVFASTTMFTFKGAGKTPKTIGEELDADVLLEGEVLRSGETVRINAQLIDPRTQGHIWNKTYDREDDPSRILVIISEVAQEVVTGLRIQLTPQEEERLASAPQVNPEAYDLYVVGWKLRNQENSESISRAIEYLKQAVAIDPTFAQAWAALVPCYYMANSFSLIPDSTRTNSSLRDEALNKALELDPDNVLAITWQGVLGGGEDSFRRALELDPNNTSARYEYALFLGRNNGRIHEALAELLLAQKLDPANSLILYGVGWMYWFLREYDKAIEYEQRALELSPGTSGSSIILARAEIDRLLALGRYEAAAMQAEETGNINRQLQAEWALGNKEKVYAIRDSMVSIGRWAPVQANPRPYIRYYAIIGNKEQALNLLETANIRNVVDGNIVYMPYYDFLRADPRFKAVLEKWGQPEVFDENGQLVRPIDETLEAYNAPGSR